MTRYIRKAPQKTCSVPAENERKAGTVPFHMNPNNKNLFLWIPLSCALSYGSVSFILLNPDITSWPLGARLFLLFYTALLACIPKLAKNNIRSLVLLVLSGIASYAFFSFLLLCPGIFICPFDRDVWDRFFWAMCCFAFHVMAFISLSLLGL